MFITELSATAASDSIVEGNSKVDVFDDNATAHVKIEIDGAEKFRVYQNGEIGLGGANYGSSGQFLKSQGSGSAAVWGDIPGGATGVDFNDGVKARFGTGNDLELYHSGSHAILKNFTGNTYLYAKGTGNEVGAVIYPDAGVELYYDNSKKLETTSTGATVTGVATVSNGIVETAATIGTNHTITTNYNAMSAGPVTVSATVTVPSGSVWTVI